LVYINKEREGKVLLKMKNITKFVMPQKRVLILAVFMLKVLVSLSWTARFETVCWPSFTMILTWKIVILGLLNNWLKASVCHVIIFQITFKTAKHGLKRSRRSIESGRGQPTG